MPKKKSGPKSKRTEELTVTLCNYLSEGMHFKYACDLAGISEETGHRWRREDAQFNSRILAAISQDVRDLVARVREKAPEKLLAKHRGYGDKSTVDHMSSDGSMTPKSELKITTDQMKKAAQAFLDSTEDDDEEADIDTEEEFL